MIIDKKIFIKWHSATKSHYENLGYIFTKIKDEFEVLVEDLPKSSLYKVKYICDYCNGSNQLTEKEKYKVYRNIIRTRRDGKDCCFRCKGIKGKETKTLKPIKKSVADYSHLLNEWNFSKNKKPPTAYSFGTRKKVWWICENRHEWEAIVANRTILNRGCPYCSNLMVCDDNRLSLSHPHLINQWHPTKNGSHTPCNFANGSSKIVWWVCNKNHEWKAKISDRTNKNTGCPYCCGNKVCDDNSLETLFPNIAKDWHPNKNKFQPNEVTSKSNKKVWWLGSCGHEWEALINSRTRGNGCPYCSGNKVCIDNSLATTHPYVVEFWNPVRNKKHTPFSLSKGSNYRIWWICDKNHEWESPVHYLTSGRGCPICCESKGEKRVRMYLENLNIYFEPQFEFDDLLSGKGNPLRFDFSLFYNNKILLLIEYDGEFHYRKIYEEDGHEVIVEHDKRKNKYCEENNIPLLRIPYWEFNNIESILKDELTKYNLYK